MTIALPRPGALAARAALSRGPQRDSGRTLLALAGIALGVALGVAVHVINQSAVAEFETSVRSLAGEADLSVRGTAAGFPEDLYPRIARLPGVAAASPALEIEARLAGGKESLKVIGLDPFRALQVQPGLLGGPGIEYLREVLAADAVLLSAAAAQWLDLKRGGVLRVQTGLSSFPFRIVGILPAEAYPGRIALLDIATAQWRLQQLGMLNRIDVRAKSRADLQELQREIAAILPAGVHALQPESEARQGAGLSRSYRVNLDMLALVALFTGAFLVFSMQTLALLRRRPQLALLRVLGMKRSTLTALILGESALMGAAGSALGVTLGYLIAVASLGHGGGDLGAGYFERSGAALHADATTLLAFFLLGLAAAVGGAWLPVWEAAHAAPAPALKAGDQERALERTRRLWPGALLLGTGAALSQAPAWHGLPLGGYLSIAAIMPGAVALMPWLMAALLRILPQPRAALSALALNQLRGAPGQASISLAAILVSFSLMVAMLIMIASFRQSLEDWLSVVLPADLYLRPGAAGQNAAFSADDQRRVLDLPGVARATFMRSQNVVLRADLPPLMLLAREIDPLKPDALPLVSALSSSAPGDLPPAWISEAVQELYGLAPGDKVALPIQGRSVAFRVAGVWRDYARQSGAILIERGLYIKISGDRLANDIRIWLTAGTTPAQMAARVRAALPGADLEVREAGELRALSLRIFDRSFAVTYALQAAAVLIGLFGISVSFSAQVLARKREFGVLRHIGMTRAQIGAMLGLEGAWLGAFGVGCGLLLGWIMSLVLVRVINYQSFHWSMDMHIPWRALTAVALLLVAAAAMTAVWSGRRAMSTDMTAAVKDDW